MFSAKRILSVPRVIEPDHLPAFIGMTSFAFRAELGFMFVIFFMARDTGARRGFEVSVAVTILASYLDVFSRQWKLSLAMKKATG